jgi:hypothetical protein
VVKFCRILSSLRCFSNLLLLLHKVKVLKKKSACRMELLADLNSFIAVAAHLDSQIERSHGIAAAADRFLSKHSLNNLLGHLRSATVRGDGELVDLLCRVVSRLLVAPRVLDSIADFDAIMLPLLDGLSSDHESIRISVAKFFLALASEEFFAPSRVRARIFDPVFVDAICHLLSDESVAVGEAAIGTLAAVARSSSAEPTSLGALAPSTSMVLVTALSTFAQRSDCVLTDDIGSVVTARVIGAVCAVSGASDAICNAAATSGLLQRVSRSLASPPPLPSPRLHFACVIMQQAGLHQRAFCLLVL